jgi:hypothetical protein
VTDDAGNRKWAINPYRKAYLGELGDQDAALEAEVSKQPTAIAASPRSAEQLRFDCGRLLRRPAADLCGARPTDSRRRPELHCSSTSADWSAEAVRFQNLPRAALAVVLVGWYLMLPHFMWLADGSSSGPTSKLSQWELYGSYVTAAECGRVRLSAIAEASGHAEYARLKEELEAAECIASDDPRLAK